MLRRRRIRSPSPLGTPFTSTSPDVGVTKRLTSLTDVVLPEPLRPSRTTVSPPSTSKLNPESTWVPATRYETSRNSMTGVAAGCISAQHTGVPEKEQSGYRGFAIRCTPGDNRWDGKILLQRQPNVGRQDSRAISGRRSCHCHPEHSARKILGNDSCPCARRPQH